MIASWAFRSLAAATIFIALVICCVFLTERMRLRMSRREAIGRGTLSTRRSVSMLAGAEWRSSSRRGWEPTILTRPMDRPGRRQRWRRRVIAAVALTALVLLASAFFVELRYRQRI